MRRRMSSGFMAMLDGLQPDEHDRRAATLTAQAVVLGNQMHIVRPFEPSVGHAEGIEERLTVANHGVPGLFRVLVLLAAEEPDHVEDGNAAVHGHAPQRIDGGIEARVLDHEHDRLAADMKPAAMVVASSSVAQVTTRMASSLSRAASTDFW